MRLLLPVLFALLLLFLQCKKEPVVIVDDTFVVETVIPNGDEQYLLLNSDYIFDQSRLPTFELYLPEESLVQINSDPSAEEYVEGTLIFEGETISPVGIRYKGSIGAFAGCLDGTVGLTPGGAKTCTKLSLKIKINWNGREERFYGLNKIQLHSQNLDESQMHERLAYWLFREMGVPAPRSIHARVMINGTYSGLYAFTEQIDGRFTKYHYENGDGNLYKEIWPLTREAVPHSDAQYLAALKTNEDTGPSAELIRTFAETLRDADESELKDVIADWMNIDEIMSYVVVDRVIKVDDGAFHWYCLSPSSCFNHNYFWYEDPVEQQLHLIPWDMDNTFENLISPANPVTPIADEWGEITAGCETFPFGFLGLPQWSAACEKLTSGWVQYEDEFELKKSEFINGPLSISQADAQLDLWAAQIKDATEEAAEAHADAVSVATWEFRLQHLKDQLEFARTH